MSTFMANKGNIVRKWYILDAAGKPLGKTATVAATLLRGKHKPEYTPHADCGTSSSSSTRRSSPHRQEAGSEDLLSSFRLCWRYEGCNSERKAEQEA